MGWVASAALSLVLRHFNLGLLTKVLWVGIVGFFTRLKILVGDNRALLDVLVAVSSAAELRHPESGAGWARGEMVFQAALLWGRESGVDVLRAGEGALQDMVQIVWGETQALVDSGKTEVLAQRAKLVDSLPNLVRDVLNTPLIKDPISGEIRPSQMPGQSI